MAAVGGRAESLLGEQGGAGEPGGVVGEDVGAVGVGVGEGSGGGGGGLGLAEQRSAVGGGSGDVFEFAAAEELLDLGLAAGPSGHGRADPFVALLAPPGLSSGSRTMRYGLAWICSSSGSVLACQALAARMTGLTGMASLCSARSAAS